jgi:bacillithiol biosynthesis cysteine-adding enzyme BshC
VRSISSDYLSEAPELRPFYAASVRQPDFQALIRRRAERQPDREALVRVIGGQYAEAGLDPGPAVSQNLQRLLGAGCFTLTTGHQLNLFGGPLFTVYKVASAIRWAAWLSEQHPGHQFVPLFWIHTEDHDFAEINHYYDHQLRRRAYEAEVRGAVGRHVLSEDIRKLWPETLPPELSACFSPGRPLGQAFRAFFHQLFGAYGLLILDADHPALKRQFVPALEAEIGRQFSFEAVQASSRQLEAAGYPLQIHPREINLFWLDEAGRDRLVPLSDGSIAIDGRDTRLSRAEWLELARSQPERFSPNVNLRPLYQETLLPNLAYFGGWGEIAYWLQLKGVFEAMDVPFPLLPPRFGATVFPRPEREAWQALGFSPGDIRRPLHELQRQYLPRLWDAAPLEALEAQLFQQLGDIEAYVSSSLSPTLSRNIAALGTKSRQYVEHLHQKALRVVRNQHPGPFREIEALKARIQPDGWVQERTWSLATLGRDPHAFVAQVLASIRPLDYSHAFLD